MQQLHTTESQGHEQDDKGERGEDAQKQRDFLETLVHELFQTEQSAKSHPLVESERLGDVPPGHAMRAVSVQAEAVLAELPGLMKSRGLPVSEGGLGLGKVFSLVRDKIADQVLSYEKSYRGTLLGMHHGLDVVTLFKYVAAANGDEALAQWCDRWIERRRPLVEAAVRELSWFAAHPELATRTVD